MKTLLLLTLCGSALALLLFWLRYVVLRRMPSTVYYYAWILVLLRFALPLPGLIPTAVERTIPETPVRHETYIQDYDEQNLYDIPAKPVTAGVPSAVSAVQVTEPTPQQGASRQSTAAKASFSVNWRSPELWLAVWALGAALSLGTTVLAYLRFTKKLRQGLHRPDRFTCKVYAAIPVRKPALYSAETVKTPLMYGVFSPKIVLPERSYDEELLHNILRHELMHYRRLDTLYKWAAAVILSAHWFNPLSWLIRRELNRACELSCDEMLLRSMTRQEKQSYGNTLLSMAASAALPAGVVATTFATEKRNLKERLVQIMNYKKSGARLLAAVLALVLLAGFGMAVGPAAIKAAADDPAESEVRRVSTVDELLAAIAPHTVIELAEGVYDLSTASDYGEDSHSNYYSWNGVWGEAGETSAELVIANVDGLTLRGAGMGNTTLAAVPRYANVIKFVNCHQLTLADLTAGHTTEPGFCMGGVLRLESCGDVSVTGCGLFGCGTVGVDAVGCTDLTVSNSRIYECSYNAVSASQCRNVRVEGCEIDSHGTRPGHGEAAMLFTANYTDGFTVHGCEIHDNAAQALLSAAYSKNARFLSNDVHDNRLVSSVFTFDQYAAVVDGCRFESNDFRFWVPDHRLDPIDINGEPLEAAELNEMTLRDIDPDIAVTPATVEKAAELRPGESIVVTTVDEFLKAIGPDRTILLDGALFDLSTAANYGSAGGEYYFWQESYDGPQLVIQNANGLSIGAVNTDNTATTLAAVPRYANVIAFRDCDDLHLFGFTAGHTKEPGSCSGGVLWFQNCHKVTVDQMRLYGCGILGLQTSQCADLLVRQTEIYECSQGAGQFFQTDGIYFESCDIHDVPNPALVFAECGDKTWNGEVLAERNSVYDVNADGTLLEHPNVGPNDEEAEFHGGVEELGNPFANEPTLRFAEVFPAGEEFAEAVQQAIVSDDWAALADRIAFPLQFFTDHYSFVIHDREEYLGMVEDGYFMNELFTDTFRFRERIADADTSSYGSCVFGNTCLDHRIAFTLTGTEPTAENIQITAISVKEPFWPGQAYAEAVPPTPQP